MMHHSLKETAHRPWPLPPGRWKWRMSWLDLAFVHYRVESTHLAAFLPEGVEVDEFEGTGWLGVVPFRMENVGFRSVPSIPPFRRILELNLRTYVKHQGKPGVWFFSLDASCWPLVWGARASFNLPYHKASIRQEWVAGRIEFASVRNGANVRFMANYRPIGEVFYSAPGTFAHWATERYCLYSQCRGRVRRVDVHHAPWPLQEAEVELVECGLLSAAGLEHIHEAPRCHFSTGVHAISF